MSTQKPHASVHAWPKSHRGAVLLLVFCTICWSIAGVFTRHLQRAESLEVTFWRSFFCVIAVTVVLSAQRQHPIGSIIRMGKAGLISGSMWAVMFTCFMVAITSTTVANTLLVSSLSPLFAAVLAWLVLGERIRPGTVIAIAAALFGIWWMVRGGVSAQGLFGMTIALGVPMAAAVNLVVLRKMHTQVDLAPAVMLGALLSCLATLPFAWPLSATTNDLLILALLGTVQLAIPCMLMVRVAKYLAAHEIALIALLEIVLGTLWTWAWGGEALNAATVQGGIVVLTALVGNELLQAFWLRRQGAASA